MNCVIAGASGLVGSELLSLLIDEERYSQVIALVRRPLERAHSKLVEVVTDFQRPETYRDRLRDVSDVFCCLGTTIKRAGSQAAFREVDFEYPTTLARTAHESGARQFLLVSAVGADSRSRIFYNRTKGEVEEAVSALPFSDGVKLFRPSILLGDRGDKRPAEAVAQRVLGAAQGLFRGPLTRYRGILAADLARAMVVASRMPNAGVASYEGTKLFALVTGG